MGKLANLKYELIAQEVVKGATPEEACVTAGLKGDRSNAWRIVRRPEVTARVAELQAKAADKALVTIDGLAQRLLNLIEVAEKTGVQYDEEGKPLSSSPKHLGVLRQSVMDLAKLYGLVTDHTKISGDAGNPLTFLMDAVSSSGRPKPGDQS